METGMVHLTLIDYAVFAITLLISVIIGFYYLLTGGRQQTTAEYLLGNQQMSILPVSFSLMASFMSAITLLGLPGEIYMYGTQFFVINLSYMFATPIAAFIFLPVFYKQKSTSVYEYLEKRFNKKVRVLASSVFMLQMTLYMSIVLYAPALALSAVTGMSKWASIISVGFVCTLYCTIGGIKAVLWTDVFQSFLMFAAMIIIIVKGTIDVGGFHVVWQRASQGNRINFFDFDLDPTVRHTFWSLAFGGIFIYLSIYGVSQIQVQRLLTVKNLKHSQISLFISWPLTSLLSIFTCVTGLVIFANYWKCDPILDKKITNKDQLVPYFVIQSLSSYQGLPGLIVAGIFSGSLSTVSSFVNSIAAVTLEDYVKPFCFNGRYMSETTSAKISKILAFIYGLLCVVLAYAAEQMSGLLQASLTVFGIVGGPLLALFTVGMCCRWCNSSGALIGFLVSLLFGIFIGFGSLLYGQRPETLYQSTEQCDINIYNKTSINLPENISLSLNDSTNDYSYIYNLSYMWYASITWAIGVFVSSFVSLLTCGHKNDVDECLLTPFISKKHKLSVMSAKLIQLNQYSDKTKL